jgi:hypothetical protein
MWLSLVSKILDIPAMVSAYFNRKQDIDLEKYKVNGQFDITLIQARAAVATARATDVVDRWGRRLIIYPTGV